MGLLYIESTMIGWAPVAKADQSIACKLMKRLERNW